MASSGINNKTSAALSACDPSRVAAYQALEKIEKTKAYSNIELNAVLGGMSTGAGAGRKRRPAGPADKNIRPGAGPADKNTRPAGGPADKNTRPGAGPASAEDRSAGARPAFVRELVYGVIKNRRCLDYFIDDLAKNGIESIKWEVKVLLRMGIYQIVFMDSVPGHSAVDETVKLAKALFRGREGFVNGMLRAFLRKRDTDYCKPSLPSADEPAKEAVSDPDKGSSGMAYGRRPIPVPDIADPIERMSVMYSCDEGLVRLFAEQYGDAGAEQILRLALETPPLFVRVNTIKTSSYELAESLRKQGFSAAPYRPSGQDKGEHYGGKREQPSANTDQDGAVTLESGAPGSDDVSTLIVSGSGILETEEFRKGLFFVQDASSTEAIKKFDPKPGEVLIDVCAAPGGKTFSAAIQMENRGTIHALDLHGNKLSALEKQAKRLGITMIDTEEHDAKQVLAKYAVRTNGDPVDDACGGAGTDVGAGTYSDLRGADSRSACGGHGADKVLCDVPCSGLGVLRRKPEIKDRPLKNDGRDLAEIQYRILTASSEYVRPGGEIMYSTCTINKTENDEVADRFLREHPDFTEKSRKLTLPEQDGPDGFFYCIFHKTKLT